MATVPTYGQPKVGQAPVPGIRLGVHPSLEAFGGGESAAQVTQGARALEHDAAREMERGFMEANEIAAMAADNQAASLQQKLESDVQGMQGKDAFGAHEYASQEWQKGLADIEKTLTNDVQKQAFYRSIARRSQALEGRVGHHVTQQQRAWDEQEFKGLMKNYNDDLARDPSDANAAITTALMREDFDKYAQRNGLGDEAYKAFETAILSDAHAAVLTARLNAGQDIDAKAYLAAHRGEMDKQDLERFDGAVKAGSTAGEARRIAGELSNYATMTEALQALEGKDIKDTDVYDQAKRRIREGYAIKAQAKDAEQEQWFTNGWETVNQNGGNIDSILPLRGLMSPTQWEHVERRAYELRMGKKAVTDQDDFDELMLMSAKDPEKFLAVDFRTRKLSDQDREKFSTIKAGIIRDGKSQSSAEYAENRRIMDQVLSTFEIDLTPADKSPNAAQKRAAIAEYRLLANRYLESRGKELNPDQKETELRNLTRGWIRTKSDKPWLSVSRMTQARQGLDASEKLEADLRKQYATRQAVRMEDIQEGELRDIIRAYRNLRGAEPSVDQILKVYNDTVNSGSGR